MATLDPEIRKALKGKVKRPIVKRPAIRKPKIQAPKPKYKIVKRGE